MHGLALNQRHHQPSAHEAWKGFASAERMRHAVVIAQIEEQAADPVRHSGQVRSPQDGEQAVPCNSLSFISWLVRLLSDLLCRRERG